ncbi:hypothetical protein TRIP_C90419 [Candidatus Zixiibacteriota bacterium]|nr:hypothetical protein TRIP_C90419 [candidate division Zixibacteria bacterium]
MQEKEYTPANSDPVLREVSKLLIDLMKIVKVVSMYPDGNPLPAKLKETFAERFLELIREQGQIQFSINQGEIRYRDNLVYKEDSAEESLALMLHNSGVTEISFGSDFNLESSHHFFKTMKSFVNKEPGAGDLINLFWQANIPGFEYSTVEDLILREYDGGIMVQEEMESGDSFIRRTSGLNDSDKIVFSNIFLDDAPAASEVAPENAINMGLASGIEVPGAVLVRDEKPVFFDQISESIMGLKPMPQRSSAPLPDTAFILNEAFAMDQIDLEKVEMILRQDAEFDMIRETVALLREMLCQENEMSEFIETLTAVEKTQSEFVRLGYLEAAGEILNIMKGVQGSPEVRIEWKDHIKSALIMAGSKEKLDILGGALNRNPQITGPELNKYLNHFGWEALMAVTGLLGELEHQHHREALCEYLEKTGEKHIDIIARGIYDRRWFVVRNTIAILAGIGGERSLGFLEKAISHEDSRVRLQVVKGLQQNKSGSKASLLCRLIWDGDAVVSQAAIEAISTLDDDYRLEAAVNIINDERFPQLPKNLQEQMLIQYSRLGGEQAVSFLIQLVDGWKMVRSGDRDIYRMMAFHALGNNKSEKAEKALLKFNRAWNKEVRRLATEAIAARRRHIYGGD